MTCRDPRLTDTFCDMHGWYNGPCLKCAATWAAGVECMHNSESERMNCMKCFPNYKMQLDIPCDDILEIYSEPVCSKTVELIRRFGNDGGC